MVDDRRAEADWRQDHGDRAVLAHDDRVAVEAVEVDVRIHGALGEERGALALHDTRDEPGALLDVDHHLVLTRRRMHLPAPTWRGMFPR